ncbi:MAG TPA: TetR family transcriptional regulator [Anaeromyxobacteraceae bacterium]|nr:TetR family transcriptional regulator [Anaeromyxobacteraceae bacterium]
MRVAAQGSSDTAERILDIAERLVQTRGFNGFSYADIAAEMGITKAGLHYHFETKAALGTQLIARYSENFRHALEAIDQEADAREKLHRYAALYARVLRKDRMCLCGMLASDYATLPKPMKEAVRRFFDENEAWLARILEEGRKARTLRFTGPTHEIARTLIASFEGAMLVARSYGDAGRFESAANRVVAQLDGK